MNNKSPQSDVAESASPIQLSAGPVTVLFEEHSSFLRTFSYQGKEAVRGIYAVVRDQNWNTVPQEVHILERKWDESSFSIEFEVICQQDEIDFRWHGSIRGNSEGTITFHFLGKAHSTFKRNRIGFCILHPLAGCVGKPCTIEHIDGNLIHSRFPVDISPHQPFHNLRSISHEVIPGVTATVLMEGDTFEMEDQRNWTDASFKTYCTPLALPFPAAVQKGDIVEQRITLSFQTTQQQVTRSLPKNTGPIRIQFPTTKVLVKPSIGFQIPEPCSIPKTQTCEYISQLQPEHLRADIRFDKVGWESDLVNALDLAEKTRSTCFAALHFTDTFQDQARAFTKLIAKDLKRVSLVALFQFGKIITPLEIPEFFQSLMPDPSFMVCAGTDAFFTELNRNRSVADSNLPLTYSINPQVHAFDSRSIMETLEAQPHTVSTARTFTHQPIVVSPITLKMRWNPNATGSERASASDRLPATSDPRQRTWFCAAWTLGSLAGLMTADNIAALTYFNTTGSAGLMEETPKKFNYPDFPSEPGEIFPVYHVFKSIAGCFPLPQVIVSSPDKIAALGLMTSEARPRLLLGNLLNEPQSVVIEDLADSFQVTFLAESQETQLEPTLLAPGHGKLTLPPYAIAQLDAIPHGA